MSVKSLCHSVIVNMYFNSFSSLEDNIFYIKCIFVLLKQEAFLGKKSTFFASQQRNAPFFSS